MMTGADPSVELRQWESTVRLRGGWTIGERSVSARCFIYLVLAHCRFRMHQRYLIVCL